MNKGLLIVVSAPSGCGKGTVLNEILKDDSFYYSISATTRLPREGEADGVNYYFISKEEFENRIKENAMLEYAEYCGNYYGTPKKELEEKLAEGKNVILEIEVQGAMQVKKLCPDGIFIFIVPPSVKELERRLKKRGTETDDVISRRVAEAAGEIKQASNYDYVVVNAALEDAVEDFKTIVKAEKLKTAYAENLINEVLENA
ncbi:guanylate kinase [Porcipelethomonas sp.]|uniref:guanylate kinase n=1 Tax=Porcipelethomonas sp. TaxID=2981675 RepID=UPI003EF989E4